MNIENAITSAGLGTAISRWSHAPSLVPKTITRDYIIALKDRLAMANGKIPDGLDKLINNFDQASHQEGKMTVEQFTVYAAAHGVNLPGPGEQNVRGSQASQPHSPSGAQDPPLAPTMGMDELVENQVEAGSDMSSATADDTLQPNDTFIEDMVLEPQFPSEPPASESPNVPEMSNPEIPLDAYA